MRRRIGTGLGVIGLLLLSGCEGAEPEDSPEPVGSSQKAKYEPSLAYAVAMGYAQDVIVVFHDDSIRLAEGLDAEGTSPSRRAVQLAQRRSRLGTLKERNLSALGALRPTVLGDYPHLPAMNLRIGSREALEALSQATDVEHIFADSTYEPVEVTPANLTLIRQPIAQSAGHLGAGTAVAVLDTGTDYTRSPFNCAEPGSQCSVAFAKDFATDDSTADSGNFHGTNVAGIILGVAPATKILALDVFDGDSAWASAILRAIDWCIANQVTYNIVALNFSLGGGLFTSACTLNPFEVAFRLARNAGILPIAASGNHGSKNALASPACAPSAVSVGAVYHANQGGLRTSVCTDATSAADKVACFANSASFLTLWAPGVGISAAGLTMTGTSQAAPHVAGAVAVLAAAFPSENVDLRQKRLTSSATMITDPGNKIKKPRLDLEYALGIGQGSAAPTGTATINDGAAVTQSPQVTLQLARGAGAASHVCIATSTKCTAFIPYSPTLPWNLTGADGKKTLYVTWKNTYGKVSTSPSVASIVLDTLPPSTGLLVGRVVGKSATWYWLGWRDLGSGIASYTLRGNLGSAPANCDSGDLLYQGTGTTWKSPALSAGKHYVRLCATDKVGRRSSGTTAQVTIR